MIKTLLVLAATLLPAAAQIPAFPGAQGFGAHATGGRGGDVYYVTNLNGSGAGSLRYGIETAPSSGRTIVFAVSGYIPLPGGNLRLVQNKITIAGQTAPGDGIGLRNGTVRVTGNNTIIRNLRIRHGKSGSGGDCLNVDSSGTNSIIDHVTMQFSTDENISFFNSTLDRFTMQNSVSAWGLESHNAGGLWDLNRGSCITSLWAHHHTRNPKARPWGLLEWINNTTYDWGIGFIMGDSQTPAPWKANVRGSYFLSPPGRTDNIALEKALIDRNGNPNFSLYLDDCLHDSDGDGLLNGTNKGYAIVAGSEYNPAEGAAPGAQRYIKAASPFPGTTGNIQVTVDDPLTAFKKVVSNAGAVRLDANFAGPLRDEVDTVLFNNLVNQTPSRITRESDLPVSNSGFGTLASGTSPADSDLDGMPDSWELALGSNPAVQNHNTVFPSSGGVITGTTFFPPNTPAGYTLLEEYLHFKAVPHAVIAKNTVAAPSSFSTDLRKFTSGFSNNPVFAITDTFGGTVSQFAADGVTPAVGGPVARFTPTQDTHGRAGFNFTVLDADGSSWTRQFALLVSSIGVPRDLLWIGGGANVWDGATPNWQKPDGETVNFEAGDTALFDERGSNSPAVNVTESVIPSAVTVAGSEDYTFSGAGSISSTGPLTKAGDGTLTLFTSGSFGGGSFLNGGETVLATGGNLDGGAIRFTGGSTLRSARGDSTSETLSLLPNISVDAGATGNLVMSPRVNVKGSLSGGGTFNIFSPFSLGAEGRVYLDGASAGCTGIVNLIGGGTGRIAFRAVGGSFNGFNNARVHLDGISVFTSNNSGGNTYAIGSLSGNASSRFAGSYSGGATTLNIGGLGLDSVFDGAIWNGTSTTHITKSGSGTLTLGGANTYTGATTVNAGTLRVIGSLGATATTVASGGTLAGNFTTGGGVTLATGSAAAPGNSPGETGTLHIAAGGLDVSGSTLKFDLSSDPASANDKITLTGGTMTLRTPAAAFEFHLADGGLGEGTYMLIDGPTSATSAPGSPSISHNLPASARQTFSLPRSGGGATSNAYVRLVVSGNAGDLTWTGSTSTWDVANTTPWTGGPGGDNRFFNLDRVLFTDSAANRTVTLTGALQPRVAEVSNTSGSYNFGGSGSLGGLASLEKSGAGTLSIGNSAANTFTGGTTISGGTLNIVNTNTPLGTGPITLSGGTLQLPNTATFLSNDMVFSGTSAIASSNSGNSTIINSTSSTFASTGEASVSLNGLAGILSINGRMDGFSGTIDFGSSSGMLRLNSNSSGANDVNFGSAAAHFDLGTAGGRLNNRNGNISINLGALSGGPDTHLSGRQTSSGDTATTYIVGAKNLSTTFGGTISHAGDLAGINLVKTGTGNWTLGGNSTFTGTVAVQEGVLTITGNTTVSGGASAAAGSTIALAGGTLGAESATVHGALHGYGTISGTLNLLGASHGQGMLTGSPGILTVAGDAFFADTAAIHLRVGEVSDTVAVANDLSLAGTLHVALAPGTAFGRYPLFNYGGSLNFGAVNLTGVASAHLSTSVAGQVDLVIDDSDEDGLPDSWEMQHFGNLDQDPDGDPDGDGTDNRTERLLGLDPRDGSSAFRAAWQDGQLEWPSAPGLTFSIYRSADLAEWEKIATVDASAGASTTFTDPAPLPTTAFYRVALEEEPAE